MVTTIAKRCLVAASSVLKNVQSTNLQNQGRSQSGKPDNVMSVMRFIVPCVKCRDRKFTLFAIHLDKGNKETKEVKNAVNNTDLHISTEDYTDLTSQFLSSRSL